MLSAEQYFAAMRYQVNVTGGQWHEAQIGPLQALVGLHYDDQGLGGQILFVVVAARLDDVTGFAVRDFAARATQYANVNVPGPRGLGTYRIAIPGLIGYRVADDARAMVTQKPSGLFGGETRPVVVDLTSGAVLMYTGTRLHGWAQQTYIKNRIMRSFPPPAQVLASPPPPAG